MSLDKIVAGFLAALTAKGVKPMHELGVEEARNAAMGYIGLQGPQVQVAQVTEYRIEVEGGHIPARVYKPHTEGKLPVVVMYHGGGFVIGNLDVIDNIARMVCKASGAVVVTIGYRKGPEYPFPTAVEDAYAGLLWTVNQAQALSLDPSRLATLGDSAGGNLATVVARMALDRKGPAIARQVLVYPVVDAMPGDYPSMVQNGEGYMLTTATMGWFMRQYVQNVEHLAHPYLSVIHSGLKGMPPATIYTAGFDPLKDQGVAYAKALREAGVEVDYLDFPSMIHGFFWMPGMIPDASRLIAHIGQTLKTAFQLPA